jgi:broad specificity phosphatase PhoE
MILYFMRHAESEANLLDILAGRKDYSLTAKGKDDAEAVAAAFLPSHPIDAIIASPLLRARQTAEPFARITRLKIRADDALVEQDMGAFGGKTYAEAEADPAYELDKSKRWDWAPPGGGESYRMIAERIKPFFERLDVSRNLDEEASKTGAPERILVVTHAVTLRLIVATLAGSLPAYPTTLARNGEILEFVYRGSGRGSGPKSLYFGKGREGRA